MVIGSCVLDIHIPGSHSLKDKRQVLKRILKQVRDRYNVSISEVGCMDLWQRSQVALVSISRNKLVAGSILEKVRHFIEKQGDIEILDEVTEYF